MAKSDDPFRWLDSSPEVIRLVVLMYVRYPLSLRNVEHLPSVDAPQSASGKGELAVGRLLPSVRPVAQRVAAGPYGSSQAGSTSRERAPGTMADPGFPAPFVDCCAILSFARLRSRQPHSHGA